MNIFQKQAIKKQFAGYCLQLWCVCYKKIALIKEGMKREISSLLFQTCGDLQLGESFGDDVKGLTKLMNGYMDAITHRA